MKPNVQIPYADLAHGARHGSPLLVSAVGRALGLGAAEQAELAQNGIPRWALFVVAAGCGLFLGAWAHRRWPKQVSKITGN